MKKTLTSVAIALCVALGTPALAAVQDLVGQAPPDVSALNQDNQPRSLAGYRGKVVVIHLCGIWCTPCREVAKDHAGMIAALETQIGADKFVFVDLLFEDNFLSPTDQTDANNWRTAFGTPAEIWHLNGDANADAMRLVNFAFTQSGSTGIPLNMVIDPNGVITYAAIGWDNNGTTDPLDGSAAPLITAIKAAASAAVQDVAIDIKPGSADNVINLSSAGVVPVAILSSADFDAPAEVDPATVGLAGASVRMVGKADKYSCSADDVNADGYIDLECRVYTAQFMIDDGDSVAVLEAETYAGDRLRGEDHITIVR